MRGQNSLDWKVLYTIEKLLRHRCLNWTHIIHLNTYNANYDQKKGLTLWHSTTKSQESLELRACMWRATYCWKALNESYNFALDLTLIKVLHNKLWASKMARVPILRILELSTWKSWEKWHLGVAPMTNCKKYYKGGRFWLSF